MSRYNESEVFSRLDSHVSVMLPLSVPIYSRVAWLPFEYARLIERSTL